MNMLRDAKFSHLGIGLAMDTHKVLIVEILTARPFTVDEVLPTEEGGVHIRGQILDFTLKDKDIGLYAAKICLKDNNKKVFGEAAPADINVEEVPGKRIRKFEISFKGNIAEEVFNQADARVLELYVRTQGNAKNIKYGAKA
jgi:hypothetical protein